MSAPDVRLDALRTVPALRDLDPGGLAWLAENARWLEFAPNDVIFEEGQPANFMLIIVEGGVQVIGAAAGNTVLRSVSAPALGGKLPFSRMEVFPGTARAVGHTLLARVEEDAFPEVIARLPGLQPHIVATLSDRVRESKQAEDEQEKLSALGRLSAGLAHELNNPAAAATRAAAQLRDRIAEERALARRLAALPDGARERLDAVRVATRVDGAGTSQLDPLARADLEDALAEWLDQHGVSDAWSCAPDLARAGLDVTLLTPVAAALDRDTFGAAVGWLAAAAAVDEAISQVVEAATRISDLVVAVKTYTHMDRARVSEIDVHEGLESTLTLLGHKLRSITIERAYDRTLPHVAANAGELNQVWMNLLDNAADALAGRGRIRLSTRREGEGLAVEIADDGPGIPPELQTRVFEAFFTTKPPGQGTGLGLDLVRLAIKRHGGDVRLESSPGNTRFTVSLPFERNGATRS